MKTLFFDIEAGGLLASNSSILSVAYGTDPDQVTPIYAKPASGSRLYHWSRQNVWKEIQKRVIESKYKWRTEQQLLTEFIDQLKGLERGSTLAGWNIGYNATPIKYQDELRGFDLPTLATRAAKYGKLSELQSALRGLHIRDVGQEYAAIAARTVLQNEGRVDPAIYEQAVGYRKALAGYGYDLFDDDIQTIAREAGTRDIRLAGWKQETIFEAIKGEQYQAHEAAQDVRAGLRLTDIDPEEAARALDSNLEFWNRRTVLNKLLSSSRYGVGPSSQAFKSTSEMWAKAGEYGLEGEFRAGLNKMAADYGVDVARLEAGRGVGIERWKTVAGETLISPGGVFSDLPSKIFATLNSNKGRAVLLGGAVALTLSKPGQWFSGKDDEYNTIEGLRHDGVAWQMRQALTDFGSGSIGAKLLARAKSIFSSSRNVPKGFSVKEIGDLARESRSMTSAQFARRLGVEVSDNPVVSASGGINIAPYDNKTSRWFQEHLGLDPAGVPAGLRELGLEQNKAYVSHDPVSSLIDILQEQTSTGMQALRQQHELARRQGVSLKELLARSPEARRGVQQIRAGHRSRTTLQRLGSEEREDVAKTVMFHEAAELKNITAVSVRDLPIGPTANQVQHTLTLPQEELFLRRLGSQNTRRAFGHLRQFLDNFSGFDDAYNTIEGLRHGGLGPELRKILTDFGSGSRIGRPGFFGRVRSQALSAAMAASIAIGASLPSNTQSQSRPGVRRTSVSQAVTQVVTPPKVGKDWYYGVGDPGLYGAPGQQGYKNPVYRGLGVKPRVHSSWQKMIEDIKKSGKKNVFLNVHSGGAEGRTGFQLWKGKTREAASAAWIGQQLPGSEGYKVVISSCNARSSLKTNRGFKVDHFVRMADSGKYKQILDVFDPEVARNIYVSPKLGRTVTLGAENLPSAALPLGATGRVNPMLLETLAGEAGLTNIPHSKWERQVGPAWGRWSTNKQDFLRSKVTKGSEKRLYSTVLSALKRQEAYTRTIMQNMFDLASESVKGPILQANNALQQLPKAISKSKSEFLARLRDVFGGTGGAPPPDPKPSRGPIRPRLPNKNYRLLAKPTRLSSGMPATTVQPSPTVVEPTKPITQPKTVVTAPKIKLTQAIKPIASTLSGPIEIPVAEEARLRLPKARVVPPAPIVQIRPLPKLPAITRNIDLVQVLGRENFSRPVTPIASTLAPRPVPAPTKSIALRSTSQQVSQQVVKKAMPPSIMKYAAGAGAVGLLGYLLFSGKKSAYNTIEGLHPQGELSQEGINTKLIRQNTDFGSAWNGLRGLMRAKETFAGMIARSDFQEALRSATTLEKAGKGVFGDAFVMQGFYRGEEFKFIKKTGTIGKYEIEAMKSMESTFGPTYYGTNVRKTFSRDKNFRDADLYMEYFEGSTLSRLGQEELSEIGFERLEGLLGVLHKKGYYHKDLHLSNLIYTDTTFGKQVAMIDFGSAVPISQAGGFNVSKDVLRTRTAWEDKLERLTGTRPKTMPTTPTVPVSSPKETPKQSLAELTAALRETNQKLQKAGLSLKQKQATAHKEGTRLASGMSKKARGSKQGSIASNGSMMRKT